MIYFSFYLEPELIRNEALNLLNKKMAEITAEHLYVYDFDTPDDEIQFIITDSRHGNVTLYDDPTKPIHNFSQADVNASRILFVHSGGNYKSDFWVSYRSSLLPFHGNHKFPFENMLIC